MNNAIQPLAPAHVDSTGAMLALAFQQDPGMSHVLPGEGERQKKLPWLMSRAVQLGHLYGETYVTTQQPGGCAIWLKPGATDISTEQLLKAGFAMAPLKLGFQAIDRFNRIVQHFGAIRKSNSRGPHWYLMMIGVDPVRQRQGLAGHLLQPVLAQADAAKLPCMLETAAEQSLSCFFQHGFEILNQSHLPDTQLRFWTLSRKPR